MVDRTARSESAVEQPAEGTPDTQPADTEAPTSDTQQANDKAAEVAEGSSEGPEAADEGADVPGDADIPGAGADEKDDPTHAQLNGAQAAVTKTRRARSSKAGGRSTKQRIEFTLSADLFAAAASQCGTEPAGASLTGVNLEVSLQQTLLVGTNRFRLVVIRDDLANPRGLEKGETFAVWLPADLLSRIGIKPSRRTTGYRTPLPRFAVEVDVSSRLVIITHGEMTLQLPDTFELAARPPRWRGAVPRAAAPDPVPFNPVILAGFEPCVRALSNHERGRTVTATVYPQDVASPVLFGLSYAFGLVAPIRTGQRWETAPPRYAPPEWLNLD